MKKLKVLSVVGTRPEIIRLSRVLAALDRYCDHVLVHTGQNYDYELNQVFFDDLGVRKPDYFLNSAEGSSGAANTIGNLITAVDAVLADVQPEALGDLREPVIEQVEIQAKYQGYIDRQQEEIARLRASEDTRLPEDIDYTRIGGLSNEIQQKLIRHRPETIGQASRIQGMTPAAISTVWCKGCFMRPLRPYMRVMLWCTAWKRHSQGMLW